jgi:nicotinamidase-related amidase
LLNQGDGKLVLLTGRNRALVLVDYQPAMFTGVVSGDKTIMRNTAYCAAKAAAIPGIPVDLSAIGPQLKREFV